MTKTLISCLALATAMATAPLHAAPVMSLLPLGGVVSPGATLDVDLQVSGLDASVPRTLLGAFDLSVQYDSALLAPLAAAFSPGSRLGDAADPAQTFYASDTSFAGTVRLLGLSLLEASATDCVFCIGPFLADLQGDSFSLGTLHFQVLDGAAPGSSVLLLPAADATLGDAGGATLSVTGDVSAIFVVPEPATLPVAATALLAAWLAGRGRRSGKMLRSPPPAG